MKFGCIVLAVLLIAAPGLPGQGKEDLPSAPSSTIKPPPAALPAQSAPAPDTASPLPSQRASQPVPDIDIEPVPPPKPAPPADTPAKQTATPEAAPSGDDTNSMATIVKVVNEVNVVFTVTDKRGRFIKDLKKTDFQVIDDNRPAESIAAFHSETDLPLQVGLLVDASNSVRDRFKFEQEAAIEFLNQIVRPSSDKAFVIGFDSTPEVIQDFTDSTELLSRGVRSLRAGGGTAMFDAIYFSCRDKLMKMPRTGPTRRAIILLSDGDDNQSHVTREEAIEMAQRAEVIVYAISTNVSGTKQRGDKVLERIADATGGRAFFPFKIQDVADAFTEIQDELRSQYALSYKPADFRADGRYRTIDIVAQNHKNLRVRCRRGYYAPSR
jgi:Ca-activated chloride channel family protein